MKTDLKIGGYTWSYTDEATLTDLKDTLGSCEYQKLEIKVSNDITGDIKKCTIFHEILHALLISGGLSPAREEDLVDVLANQLLIFVKENQKFIMEHLIPPTNQ